MFSLTPMGSIPYFHQMRLISGPCSAESREQILKTGEFLSSKGRGEIMRAGVWKPRTRPGGFEGKGREALAWLQEMKQTYQQPFAVEVARPDHVDAALRFGADALWIGARTSVNPFLVEEIAFALSGVKVPIWVKNPISPDVDLWQGAIERMENKVNASVSAIHRGFMTSGKGNYRNPPLWRIPLELMRRRPEMEIICDPSHISGQRDLLPDVAATALELGMKGLMIEIHPDPDLAMTDAQQQLNFAAYDALLKKLTEAERVAQLTQTEESWEEARRQIDKLDETILGLLGQRMELSQMIGEKKKMTHQPVFQPSRWEKVLQSRQKWGAKKGMPEDFVRELFELIHDESTRVQTSSSKKSSPPSQEEGPKA